MITILKFLPELISLIKLLIELGERGYQEIEIRKAFKDIENAFKIKDAQARARALNDVFRK